MSGQGTGLIGPKTLARSLPDFQGGKRKLWEPIFKAIHAATGGAPAHTLTLLDAFSGGGSVSLIGKALGYRVIANDLSPLAEAVARALVVNSRVRLRDEDVELALSTEPGSWYMPPVEQLLWPEDVRQRVAGIVAAAESQDVEERRWLLRALAVKTALRVSAWGQPSRMTLGRKLREKRYGDVTPGQSQRIKYMVEPRRVALQSAREMDAAVFSNGHDNEFHRRDVLEFLEATAGDVAYLDPPYPGTESYETSYVGVASLLEGRPVEAKASRFSDSDGWRFLAEVFEAAARVRVVVLSLHNSVVGPEPLVEIAEAAGRRVEVTSVAHLIFNNSLPNPEKSAANRELVVTATLPD